MTTHPRSRVRLERVLGRPDATRLVIDQVIFDLSRPDLLRLGQEVSRVLASIAQDDPDDASGARWADDRRQAFDQESST